MVKKTYKQSFFTKNHDIFATPVSFARIGAMYRPRFETQWSETVISQKVPRDVSMSRGIPFVGHILTKRKTYLFSLSIPLV